MIAHAAAVVGLRWIGGRTLAPLLAATALSFAICMSVAHAGEVAGESDHQPSACIICLAATADDDEPRRLTAFAGMSEGWIIETAPPLEEAPVPPPPHQLRPRAPPVSE
jgi:hypothetical protein